MEFDPNRKIFKKLTDGDTTRQGRIYLPKRMVKNNLLDHMDADLKRRVSEEKEELEVVLHNVIDGSTSNVKLRLESRGYVFKHFYSVVKKYDLKTGYFCAFNPIVGEAGEPIIMEFHFSRDSPIAPPPPGQ